MDIFKSILEFYGEIMPRTKKPAAKSVNLVKESDVATLAVNLLDVYKSKCKNELVTSQNLTKEQVLEVAQLLDIQHSIIKPQVFEQVNLIFKK